MDQISLLILNHFYKFFEIDRSDDLVKKYEKYFSHNISVLEKEEFINFLMPIKETKRLEILNNKPIYFIEYLLIFAFILYILYLFYFFWINRKNILKDFFSSSLKIKRH